MHFFHKILKIPKDAKSEEHEKRVPAIFPPAVLIFGLPMPEMEKRVDGADASMLIFSSCSPNFLAVSAQNS